MPRVPERLQLANEDGERPSVSLQLLASQQPRYSLVTQVTKNNFETVSIDEDWILKQAEERKDERHRCFVCRHSKGILVMCSGSPGIGCGIRLHPLCAYLVEKASNSVRRIDRSLLGTSQTDLVAPLVSQMRETALGTQLACRKSKPVSPAVHEATFDQLSEYLRL